MAILTILAIGQSWLSDFLSWSVLGYMLLVVGIAATFFSGKRYLLGYLLGGMSYWVIVEGVQSIMVNTTAISSSYSYAAAILLTWVVIGAFLTYRYKKFVASLPVQRTGVVSRPPRSSTFAPQFAKRRNQGEKYIEHTPIYNNYEPRFRN